MNANVADAAHFQAPSPGEDRTSSEDGSRVSGSVDAAVSHTDVEHAVTRDNVDRKGAEPNLLDYLRHAQMKSGRRPMELAREYFRLYRGRGRLTLPEYVQYGVYDTARYSAEEQSRFLSLAQHWPITRICCDMTWQATTEDKWLCAHILARAGIPVPETLAVIDRTDRAYPGTHKISTAAQFREFVTSSGFAPFFGKENRGICSLGAFLAEGGDVGAVHLTGQGALAYDAFMDQFIGSTPYLLQQLVTNHGFFDRYTNNLATVRVCILVTEAGVRIPFAILKLPAKGNLADSFWRPGNLACNLDVASGAVLRIRSKDKLGTTDYDVHPETRMPLIGEKLPMWDQVIDLAKRCAPIFQPVRYQSMDIAITPNGPVLIEINTGGGYDLPQLASGEGFLTDEVCEFFRACGYTRV